MVELKCPKCAAPMAENSRFCSNCGAQTDPSNTGSSSRLSDSGALQLRNLLFDEAKGEYEIEEELGRGGMAVVFKAREVHLNRAVAIKVLPPDLTFARGSIERFQREARTAAALDHPNIIPIFRISPGGKLFWYAMKFLEGRSLAQVLEEKGLLTIQESLAILEQVADALDYAHQRSVIHRDIKPGNIMLDARGRVTVTDFGIAKELSTGGALTGSGAILGTPYYMSPEQCRGGKLTGAADQYSLGVVAYQMISGQLPFEADSAIDLLHKHVTEPPPPLDSLLPGLAKHVTNSVDRAMAKKPEDRFPSVMSFVKAIRGERPNEATLVIHSTSMQKRLAAAVVGDSTSKLVVAGRILVATVAVGGLVAGSVWLATKPGAGASVSESAVKNVIRAPTSAPAATSPSALPAPTTGLLVIESLPAGGRVRLDGRDTAGTRFELGAGVHSLRLTAPGYDTMSAGPTVALGDTSTVRFNARALSGQPPAPSRRSPPRTARADSPARAAEPVAAAPRPAPARDTVAARPGVAARKGRLVITVQPSWANISVNGEVRGAQRGIWADSLAPGRYTVSVAREGWETTGAASRRVEVRAGRETSVAFTIRQRSQP